MTQANPARIRITPLAFSLSAFFAVTYLLCVAGAWIFGNVGGHALLQFFPRFAWNAEGIHDGLIASLAYGFYTAILFGALFAFFTETLAGTEGNDREEVQ